MDRRIDAKRKELLRLKQELRRAKGAYKRAVLRGEIAAVARELARMEEYIRDAILRMRLMALESVLNALRFLKQSAKGLIHLRP